MENLPPNIKNIFHRVINEPIEKLEPKKFIEHRPAYFTGYENNEHIVNTFNEVLEIPFVKNFSEQKNFYSYAVNVERNQSDYKLSLMAMYDFDDEYNGCKFWLVVGDLPGFIMFETKLKLWTDLKAGHKPTCWIRKYKSCEDLLGHDRDESIQMKILQELGWSRPDMFGVAVHCDCGWNNLINNEN
jgi:hypothetical protein